MLFLQVKGVNTDVSLRITSVPLGDECIFHRCIESDKMKDASPEQLLEIWLVDNLYLFACIYNGMGQRQPDSACFEEMKATCVERNATDPRCHEWHCASPQDAQVAVLKAGHKKMKDEEEDEEDGKSTTKSMHKTKTTEKHAVLRAGGLRHHPIVNMKNTDKEDRMLDPTRRDSMPSAPLNRCLSAVFIISQVFCARLFS
ncbi:unnamed protein product [Gongylonema pulchrum]|uniref:Uncharacterized protein n=1 Tax=Gongylonema pulchrum TaxID=637853 RepID=A0A3P6R5U7_9BILA|nr:unnamed protein product [Gongylonema pulchrum]